YKQDTGAGTLHPPVAAALARLACGVDEPPRLLLDPFCGDGTVAIEAATSYPDAWVAGAELDPARLANARANADRARARVRLVRADAGRPPWHAGAVDAVVTNPPWHLAVAAAGQLAGGLAPFWRELPRLLSRRGRVCLIADADLEPARTLVALGFDLGLQTRIRLAGRVSELVLAAPPGRSAPALPASAATWRSRAIAAGVVTQTGF
ncbi:MAG TPA: methyltransferase domain-containing protein, partial [Micromonosporaceae bacterium]